MHRTSPDGRASAATPSTRSDNARPERPEPLVSVQSARLALARTHAAAQEALSPRLRGFDVERKARIAMNLSWSALQELLTK